MSILEDLLKPTSLQEFSENYLFKSPYASPLTAQRFEGLVSWPLMKEIFESQHKDCWLPQKGILPTEADLSSGLLTYEQARTNYEAGRTVLVRHAEKAHPRFTEIANNFHEVFKDPIDIQVYCTPAGNEGFDWHYDVEEVFVIQSLGEKEFRLKKNTVNPWPSKLNIPRNLQFEKEVKSPEIRCHLKAGDWLYIPSGWWHKAQAITDSAHLSVGVMARTSLDYLQSLLPLLAENPFWRQRLPLHEDSEILRERLKALQTSLIHQFAREDKMQGFTNRLDF